MRRLWRALYWTSALSALAVVLVVVFTAITAWVAVRSEVGAVQLLSWIPGLTVVEPRGSILGDFQAQRVELRLPRQSRLVLQQPRWQGLRIERSTAAAWHLALSFDGLQATSADLIWHGDPASTGPRRAPERLVSPIGLRIQALTLGRLQSNVIGPQPITDLKASVTVQSVSGTHEVVLSRLVWQGWTLQGQGRVATSGALTLTGQWRASSSRGQGALDLEGTVAKPHLHGQVSIAAAKPADAAQALTVDAWLQPFEPWPVLKAEVRADHLDLQQLLPAAPFTALSGEAIVQPRDAIIGAPGTRAMADKAMSKGKAAPKASDLLVSVRLRNDRPALWDAAGLPLTEVKASLMLPAQADASAMGQVGRAGQVDALVTLVGQNGRAPGVVTLSGRWDLAQRSQTSLTAKLDQVDLRALHTRSPPLMLQGRAGVQGQADLSWALQADVQGREVSAKSAVPKGRKEQPGQPSPLGPPAVKGLLAQAKLDAQWWPDRVLLRALTLEAGGAQAQVQGQWQRDAAAKVGSGESPWHADGRLQLKAFDPAVWVPWPRPVGDAVQRTRLDGEARLTAQGRALDARWQQGLTAQLQGQLSDSVLLGVPVQSQFDARTGERWQAQVQVQAGGNDLQWQASIPAGAVSTLPAWPNGLQAQLKANIPNLAAWQGWAQVAGFQGLSGHLSADATWQGTSPDQWTTTGVLQGDAIKAMQDKTPWLVQGLSARWSLGEGGPNPPKWQFDGLLAQAQRGTLGIQQGQFQLQGQRADHRVKLQAQVTLPERKLSNGSRVREVVQVDGAAQAGLQGTTALPAWRAQVQTLRVLPVGDASAGPWLQVSPFDVRWQRLADGQQWSATPTTARVFGAEVALQQGQWRQGPGGEQSQVLLTLSPLRVSELLGRWQPQAGWGGDLTLVGRLQAQQDADGQWRVDAGLNRQAGDLSLQEPGIDGAAVQRLGVRDVNLSLKGANGVWTAVQAIDARVLGSLSGQQQLRSQGPRVWPAASDPLTGSLSLKVANLRTASVWAPAGWRVSGQLAALAQVSGTLGAPLLSGRVTGQDLSVGNALLGVQVTEGDLSMLLSDQGATIERLVARGGELGGRLSITGQAQWGGETPTAQLALQAQQFGLLHRVDRRAVVSGDLQATLQGDTLKADGRFKVDEGLVDITHSDAPTVGDDVNVVNRPGVSDDDAEAAQAAKRKLLANITLDLGPKLRLKGRGLDTRLSGALRLSTPNGRSQLQGTIQAVEGTYAAYGQKLLIERGSIAFTGSIENPRLDILAMRAQSATAAASDVKVGVQISGTALDPRVRLYSEPAMSETEKLSWLVLGRGPVGLGGADLGLLQTAASALLDGEGPSAKDTVLSTLGLDELSVRQTDGAVKDTIVAVGKQISTRWYLGYERSLNATTGSWQAIYRLAQRFTLRAQAGDDNALDLIWSRRWN